MNAERQQAYKTYCDGVEKTNAKHGTNLHPYPYETFEWQMCVLCETEIRDDPFGHNPQPAKEDGVCCSQCNRLVIYMRLKDVIGENNAWEVANNQ